MVCFYKWSEAYLRPVPQGSAAQIGTPLPRPRYTKDSIRISSDLFTWPEKNPLALGPRPAHSVQPEQCAAPLLDPTGAGPRVSVAG